MDEKSRREDIILTNLMAQANHYIGDCLVAY